MGKAGSKMPYVFISYSHKDKEYAHRLEKALKRRDFEVWLDDRIDYGTQWPKEIERRLDGCKAMILIMTAHSRGSDWVQNELARAKSKRKNIFPLLLEGDGPWLSVQATQYVDVRDGRLPTKAFYDTFARVVPRKGVRASEQIGAKPASKPTPDEQQPKVGEVVTNSTGMKLVYIPAGSFMMGSSHSAAQLAKEYDTNEDRFAHEFPQHQVRISEGFWMGQTEVTQGQYKSVMNAEPSSGKEYVQEAVNNPATYVSWIDAVEFCTKLSQKEGETYRLPTEAEWEYACRAGTTTAYYFGDSPSKLSRHGWFEDNSGGELQPVGGKLPNPWGLHDMHGNVWEWCLDRYATDYYSKSPESNPQGPDEGSYRVNRGGSWYDSPRDCRSAVRTCDSPSDALNLLGFRVARSFVSK